MPTWLIVIVVVVAIVLLALSQLPRAKTKTVSPPTSTQKRDVLPSSPGKYGATVQPSERFPNRGDRAISNQSSAKPRTTSSSAKKPQVEEEDDPILKQLKASKGAWTPGGYKIPPGKG